MKSKALPSLQSKLTDNEIATSSQTCGKDQSTQSVEKQQQWVHQRGSGREARVVLTLCRVLRCSLTIDLDSEPSTPSLCTPLLSDAIPDGAIFAFEFALVLCLSRLCLCWNRKRVVADLRHEHDKSLSQVGDFVSQTRPHRGG